MTVDGSDAFSRQVLVISVGMLLPAVPVALTEDVPHNAHHPLVPLPLIRAVEYDVFLFGLGLVFTIGSWFLIERGYLDRVSFLLASLIWPWVISIGSVFFVLLVAGPNWSAHPVSVVYHQLTGGGQVIDYGIPFFLGGIIAYGLSRIKERYKRDTAVEARHPAG